MTHFVRVDPLSIRAAVHMHFDSVAARMMGDEAANFSPFLFASHFFDCCRN